jgi:hypothetical protein
MSSGPGADSVGAAQAVRWAMRSRGGSRRAVMR